jgi:hypothetical protein
VKPAGRVSTPGTRKSHCLSALTVVVAESDLSTTAEAARADAAMKVAE